MWQTVYPGSHICRYDATVSVTATSPPTGQALSRAATFVPWRETCSKQVYRPNQAVPARRQASRAGALWRPGLARCPPWLHDFTFCGCYNAVKLQCCSAAVLQCRIGLQWAEQWPPAAGEPPEMCLSCQASCRLLTSYSFLRMLRGRAELDSPGHGTSHGRGHCPPRGLQAQTAAILDYVCTASLLCTRRCRSALWMVMDSTPVRFRPRLGR